MTKKPYYVILTGSKNNAGDFLIKYRAKELFQELRPDREIIDIDGWKPFDDEVLNLVNGSEALLLMGGPALQKNMYPNIYPLVEDLSRITTKIALMGVGWKSHSGLWSDSQTYLLSDKTKKLLTRIESDGLASSVRDYHTWNVLSRHGMTKIMMTGCPATYVIDQITRPFSKPKKIQKVGFSLGVSFIDSEEMLHQMRSTIIGLKAYFDRETNFEVVFHHSTKQEFLSTHNATSNHLKAHQDFIEWLNIKKIGYVDISGSAENLINYYSSCDLHVGYRVHAHIFMNSVNKASILIAEDGRGKALRDVFGGLVIDGFKDVDTSLVSKVFRKLSIKSGYHVYNKQDIETLELIKYEIEHEYPRLSVSRTNINSNFRIMKDFLQVLP